MGNGQEWCNGRRVGGEVGGGWAVGQMAGRGGEGKGGGR